MHDSWEPSKEGMLEKQKREINTFIQMICGIIAISKSVTLLLSSEIICGIIAISKSIIILSEIRGSCIFEGNLWHKHDQCKCQSVARGSRYFPNIKWSYVPLWRMHSSKDSLGDKIFQSTILNNIHHYIPKNWMKTSQETVNKCVLKHLKFSHDNKLIDWASSKHGITTCPYNY